VPWTMIGLPGMIVPSLEAFEEAFAQHWRRRFEASGGTTGTSPGQQCLVMLGLI
jgi:hypothetical protein